MIPILSKLSKRFLSSKPSSFRRFLYDKIDFSAQIIGLDALKKVLYMLCSTTLYEVNKSKLSA